MDIIQRLQKLCCREEIIPAPVITKFEDTNIYEFLMMLDKIYEDNYMTDYMPFVDESLECETGDWLDFSEISNGMGYTIVKFISHLNIKETSIDYIRSLVVWLRNYFVKAGATESVKDTVLEKGINEFRDLFASKCIILCMMAFMHDKEINEFDLVRSVINNEGNLAGTLHSTRYGIKFQFVMDGATRHIRPGYISSSLVDYTRNINLCDYMDSCFSTNLLFLMNQLYNSMKEVQDGRKK